MNCRKRKVDFIDNLAVVVDELKEKRDDLLSKDKKIAMVSYINAYIFCILLQSI